MCEGNTPPARCEVLQEKRLCTHARGQGSAEFLGFAETECPQDSILKVKAGFLGC